MRVRDRLLNVSINVARDRFASGSLCEPERGYKTAQKSLNLP